MGEKIKHFAFLKRIEPPLFVYLAGNICYLLLSSLREKSMKSKILIVDDVNFFLDIQRKMLHRVDCEILTAKSGLEALRTIKKKKPQLVLLDYNMPDLNGDKACEILKNDPRYCDIPIIIVSSDHSSSAQELCQKAGADYYMTKPIDQSEFIEAISKLLKLRSSLYYPRALLRSEVYTRIEGEVKRFMSVDISLTGIYLESTKPLAVNETVTLHFTIPVPRRDIKVMGRVSRVVTEKDMLKYGFFPGMALEFINLDLEDRRYIEKYIERAYKMRKHDLTAKDDRVQYI
jgi:twitching motility two-component system response regulator PilG